MRTVAVVVHLAGRSLQLAPSHAAAEPLYAAAVCGLAKTRKWALGHVALAWAHCINGDYESSLDPIKEEFKPGFTPQWPLLVCIYALRGDEQAARDTYLVLSDRMARLSTPNNPSRTVRKTLHALYDPSLDEALLDFIETQPVEAMTNDERILAYGRMIERLPESGVLHRFRGTHYAFNGDWELAVAEYERASNLPSTALVRPACWTAMAAIYLYLGDEDGYAIVCDRFRDELAGLQRVTDNSRWAWESNLVIMHALHASPNVDWKETIEVADRIEKSGRWIVDLARTMAAYRSHNYDSIRFSLPSSQKAITSPIILSLGAMAYHRLGQTEEAKQLLVKARVAVKSRFADIEGPTAHWQAERAALYCIAYLMLGEAEELIDGRTTSGVRVTMASEGQE